MREIYLIRHGLPEFPDGKKVCIGHTDLHLSTIGKMQAFLAEKYFNDIDISNVFCSRLKRAIQTAEFFNNPIIIDGLEEMNFGVWDGFSFDEIKFNGLNFMKPEVKILFYNLQVQKIKKKLL